MPHEQVFFQNFLREDPHTPLRSISCQFAAAMGLVDLNIIQHVKNLHEIFIRPRTNPLNFGDDPEPGSGL